MRTVFRENECKVETILGANYSRCIHTLLICTWLILSYRVDQVNVPKSPPYQCGEENRNDWGTTGSFIESRFRHIRIFIWTDKNRWRKIGPVQCPFLWANVWCQNTSHFHAWAKNNTFFFQKLLIALGTFRILHYLQTWDTYTICISSWKSFRYPYRLHRYNKKVTQFIRVQPKIFRHFEWDVVFFLGKKALPSFKVSKIINCQLSLPRNSTPYHEHPHSSPHPGVSQCYYLRHDNNV